MPQDETIELARQAGFRVGPSRDGPDDVWGVGANLERFAKLAAEKEREACAKVADGWPDYDVQGLAEAIRARGQE